METGDGSLSPGIGGAFDTVFNTKAFSKVIGGEFFGGILNRA